MYTTQASLLRAKSTVSLLKVCRSPCCSSSSNTWLDKLLRNLSTSSIKWDFQNTIEDCSELERLDTAWSRSGGQNPGGFQQNLNPTVGLKGNHVDDYVRETAINGMVSGQNPNGFFQKSAVPDKMSSANENRRNSSRDIGGFDLQRKHSKVYSEGVHGSRQNQNGGYGEMSQGIHQNWNGYSQNPTGNGGRGESVHQQSPSLQTNLSTPSITWDFMKTIEDYSELERLDTPWFHRGGQNHGGFQQNLNPPVGLKGNHVNDCLRESAIKGMVSGQNPNEFCQNYTNPDKMSSAYENRRNSGRDIGGFDLYSGKCDKRIQQNHSEVYSGRVHGSRQNQNGGYGEMSQGIHQNWNGYNQLPTGNGGRGENGHQQSPSLHTNLSTPSIRGDFMNTIENYSELERLDTPWFRSGGQNPGGFQQNLNPRIGLKGNHVDNSVRESAMKGMVSGQNPNGFCQNSAVPDKMSSANENGRNSSRDIGGFDLYSGKCDTRIQRNHGEVYSEGVHGSRQNQNGGYGEMSQGIHQNWNGYSQNPTGNGGGGESAHQRSPSLHTNLSTPSFRGDFMNTIENCSELERLDTPWFHSGGQNPGGTSQSPNDCYSQVQSHDQGNLRWNNTQSGQTPNTNTGQYCTNSDYQSGGSSSQPGNVSYSYVAKSESDFLIEEFDAFCREGKLKDAITNIKSLESKGHSVDLPRLLRLAQLCGEAEALQEAKTVHEHFASVSISDISSHNILIEMYSNCGSVDDALSIFFKMPEKNSETWDTIIRCLAKNGLEEDAMDMFTRFKKEGNKPDSLIFKGVFYVCAVLGDINEGLLHFEAMYKEYGIIPTMEHYVSVVEMLASPGYLDEALDFVEKMPIEPNVDVWETLMNLSRVHGDLELGDRCAELVDQLDGTRLDKQSREGLLPVKESDVLKEKLKKTSGTLKPLEIRSKVHEFRAGDTAHPDNDKLYGLLKSLKAQMVEMGYVPDLRFVLHDVDPETKEEALLAHSERLAFAQGLLTTPARSTIRVIKNLRVCVDCHNALKIMAKIVGREFVMRDAKRFHHLKGGDCSCKDYW